MKTIKPKKVKSELGIEHLVQFLKIFQVIFAGRAYAISFLLMNDELGDGEDIAPFAILQGTCAPILSSEFRDATVLGFRIPYRFYSSNNIDIPRYVDVL